MITIPANVVFLIFFFIAWVMLLLTMLTFEQGSFPGRIFAGFALVLIIIGFVSAFIIEHTSEPEETKTPPEMAPFTLEDLDQLLTSIGFSDATRTQVRRLHGAMFKATEPTPESVDQVLSLVPEVDPDARARLHLLIKGHLQEQRQ